MSYTLEYEFAIGTPVHIDGCTELTGYVTAVQWRHLVMISYEVCWVTNGKAESAIIEGWRLVEKP